MRDAMTIAATGMRTATAQFNTAAAAIVTGQAPRPANSTQNIAPEADTATRIVDIIDARAAFVASLAVFQAADKTAKSLLDVLA